LNKLREVEVLVSQGATIGQASRKIGVTEQTYYRGRKEYGGMKVEQAKCLKDPEKENTRLKKLVADLSLDNAILKRGGPGKLLSPSKRHKMVTYVCEKYHVSERRACRAAEQARTTQRNAPVAPYEKAQITGRIIQLANPVWSIRVPNDHRAAAGGWVEGESQTGGADLAEGRTQGPEQTAQTGTVVAE
jgi:transposase-like protein